VAKVAGLILIIFGGWMALSAETRLSSVLTRDNLLHHDDRPKPW
jgi:hypothetical protein